MAKCATIEAALSDGIGASAGTGRMELSVRDKEVSSAVISSSNVEAEAAPRLE